VPEDTQPVCSKCYMPAILADGTWVHAEPADAVFCQMVMQPVREHTESGTHG
jgi:hypothetical protein